MLRDNLAGLIEPRLSSAGAHNLGGHPKRDKLGDAPGQPSWRSSLLNDPSAKFFAANPGDGQKNKWPGLKVTTPAHDSRAVRTAHHKSHRTIDPQCLENPRPEGAESTLTKNAASPFPAEPRHYGLAQIYAALNDKENTFKWLQTAYDDRAVWMGYLAVDPIFDRYRSDERFKDLLRRIDLP